MLFEILKERFPRMKKNEPLFRHCMFRAGGQADYFYEIYNIEEIPELLTLVEENSLPYLFIGRGSNVLFRDGGFRGLVIKNLSNHLVVEGQKITAASGVLLSTVIQTAIMENLSGLEPLYGLPGSIGGAVYGNSGVPGTEISDFVEKVTVFNVEDGVREFLRENLDYEYRKSRLKKENKDCVMWVTLKLKKGDQKKSQEEMRLVDEIRRGKQPAGFTCGSFFKNPSKEKTAGFLIDKAGLKGKRVGDAQISLKHGNFFMNVGNAKASDILALSEIAKKEVKEKFGIELQEEVRILGED